MKTKLANLAMGVSLACAVTACQTTVSNLEIEHQGDTLTVIRISKPSGYLILPIEETCEESKVKLETGSPADVAMDIRLANDKVDYYVPFELPEGEEAVITVRNVADDALCWDSLRLSDTFDSKNTDFYRPYYHHTPLYGWMNDPNGMVYHNGEYHLYYQYNPYGSKWGNMHWGHSVSKDLIHWTHLSPAIARDTLGHIFSGSTVIDYENTAGYGKEAMIALYTSASDERGQVQSMAYSTDNGRTFTKYEHNPVLTPFDGLRDFRDPKVFWYEPEKKWVMIVSADKNMRFYSSADLKEWEYMSEFGEGYGVQPNQFECPDFVQLPVNGDVNHKKWVMIVNINPGCMFGGSATMYFVGDFDGKRFTCDSDPNITKWLDYGKDHYAAVCFSNTGNRVVSLSWMSNWQYANITPIKQYRGANGLPRELSLYTKGGETYLASDVVRESDGLRKDSCIIEPFSVDGDCEVKEMLSEANGAYELEMDVTPGTSRKVSFDLLNGKGEIVKMYLDMKEGRLVMDRTASGVVDLGELSEFNVHEKEVDDHRKHLSVNYRNDFALGTWAPLNLCEGKTYHLNIFVDKCSVEIFVDGGRIAMTNLVFPTAPYDTLRFSSEGGKAKVDNMKIYKIGL